MPSARPMTRRRRASSVALHAIRRLRSWDVALAAGRSRRADRRGSGSRAPAACRRARTCWRSPPRHRSPGERGRRLRRCVGVAAGAIALRGCLRRELVGDRARAVQLYTVALLGDRQRSLVVGALTAIVAVVAIVLIDGSVELTGIGVAVAAGVRVARARRHRSLPPGAARGGARAGGSARRASARRSTGAGWPTSGCGSPASSTTRSLTRSSRSTSARASRSISAIRRTRAPRLQDIKQASATALRDLRATLGLLREPDDAAPDRAGARPRGAAGTDRPRARRRPARGRRCRGRRRGRSRPRSAEPPSGSSRRR